MGRALRVNDSRRRTKDSQRQERESMERMGGQRHGGSGAAWSRKADGRVNRNDWTSAAHSLVEFKRTDKQSISLKKADLRKITDEAMMEGRIPLLGVEIDGDAYIVMEESHYMELRDAAEVRTVDDER